MRYFLVLVIIHLLAACTPSTEKKEDTRATNRLEKGAYIGYLESVTLNYADWLSPLKPNPSNPDELIVSNNCGHAIGTYKIFTANTPPTTKIQVVKGIGEWCRNPFVTPDKSTSVYLILLDDQSIVHGNDHSYFAKIFPIYATDFEVFVDIRNLLPLYDNSKTPLYHANLLSEYNLLDFVQTLREPVYIDNRPSHYTSTLNREYFGIEKNNIYAKKSLVLNQKFPEISKFLINNNLIAHPPFGPFIPPDIDQMK